jgi:Cu-processing system ATP-binding protein
MQQEMQQENQIELLPVELQGVSKRYGGVLVLEQINLSVVAGECIVLVGHNGAGKTTLMKLLLGLIRPSAGKVRVLGDDPAAASSVARRGSLGYLPESIVFDEAMTGRELLNFYARLKSVNGTACDELLTRVGIADAADRRLSTWSKGMRQRLGLAQAMLGNPRLLLLDEPTSGLDPSLRTQFYEIVESLRADGVTVLISSHSLSEVEEHADRVVILQQGRILACGALADLSEQAALPIKVRITCAPDRAEIIVGGLKGDGLVQVNQLDDQYVELICSHPHKMAVLQQITNLGDAIMDVDIRTPRLDEIYAYFMTREMNKDRHS